MEMNEKNERKKKFWCERRESVGAFDVYTYRHLGDRGNQGTRDQDERDQRRRERVCDVRTMRCGGETTGWTVQCAGAVYDDGRASRSNKVGRYATV